MAPLLLAFILLAFTASASGNWCVCKDGNDAVLQKTLDYACGAGADCNPIRQNGPCFQPNTVRAHCNYAVNSYFQRKGQTQGACEFAGTATVSSSDPSTSGCTYPSSASAGTSTSPVTTTPSTSTGSTGSTGTSTGTGTGTGTSSSSSSSTTTATPYSSTPGVLGGIGNGIAPSGAGMNSDDSHGGPRLMDTSWFSSFSILLFSGLMIQPWWG